ncbi:MAG: DUF3788 domain-containing protein [Defluviitaleaceae bacterium]|nr:DUF3788 domain-containing protein [Defluviitaleaceae bacterium]
MAKNSNADDNTFVSAKKRLFEKAHQPTEAIIQSFMGDDAWQQLMKFEGMLRKHYNLNREMKFPFGRNYGWSFRYTHNKSLLLYVFFEEGGLSCTLSINDKGAPKVEAMLNDLQPDIQTLWKNRYPCGDVGGWIHCSIENEIELSDIIRLLGAKVKQKPQ